MPYHHRPLHLELIFESSPTTAPTRPELNEGEHYAGIILGKDGEADHHLILLPGEETDINWADAKEWAAKKGGELPARREQSLLFANMKEQFRPRGYWSCEEYSANYTWGHYFYGSGQGYNNKDNEFCARAIRRVPVTAEYTFTSDGTDQTSPNEVDRRYVVKPLDIEAALAGAKVMLRSGRTASVVHYNPDSDAAALLGYDEDNHMIAWYASGYYCTVCDNDEDILGMVTTRRVLTRWVNVYEDGIPGPLHSTKEDADAFAHPHRIACVQLTGDYEV